MSLVTSAWLEKNLRNVKIVDCSWHMPGVNRNPYEEYSKNHIPDLDKIDVVDQYPTKKYLKKFIKNFNNFKEISKYWKVSQTELNLDKKIKFFKTHHINCKIDNNSFTDIIPNSIAE